MAVSFDANGTLFEPRDLGGQYREVLARHGIEANAAELERLVSLVWTEMSCAVPFGTDRFASHPGGARGWWSDFLDRLLAHLDRGSADPFAAAELFDRFAKGSAWRVFPEVPAVLARIEELGLEIAVVSNFDERLPRIGEELGLGAAVGTWIYSQQVGVEKPHPAIFRAACDTLGVSPRQAVHVGDRQREDVEGAVAVGMGALLLERRGGSGGNALHSLADLVPWIEARLWEGS
ncbi:MAG TPA: HAD-IA family hydrolase [Thermoanaerobaculia bacterium]|nr:HAD-IA family hydrolase [Thermoanaerobaculia bacterium]